jgi:Holliday junction resolvasome RuvABC endonuclease subunit
MKIIIGVDPGLSGGLAVKHPDSPAVAYKMPDTPKGIYELLKALKETYAGELTSVVERVGFYRPGNSAVSACKFARHCGSLEMALLALNIPIFYVVPNKWMKDTVGECPKEKGDRKRYIKERMEQMYPHIKVTLDTADALGILTYGLKNQQALP